jgi:outer membrane protein
MRTTAALTAVALAAATAMPTAAVTQSATGAAAQSAPAVLAQSAPPPAAAAQSAPPPAAAVGQSAPPPAAASALRLDEAVALALATYPAVAAADAGVDRAVAARREAGADRYPALRVGGAITRYEEPMIVRPLHGFDPTSPPDFDRTLIQGEATVSYTLFDGGERAARVRRAEADVHGAAAGAAGARAVVTARVAASYLAVLTAGEVTDSHERRLTALLEEERRVAALLAEGQAPAIQLLRVQAALESAEAEAVAARGELVQAELELARLTGASPDRTQRGRLVAVALRAGDAPARATAVERALSANPDVTAARRALDAARASAAMVRSARWPRVDAFGTYWERGGGDTSLTGEWGAGLRVSYPLFTGGAISGRIEQAAAGERAARERLRLAELDAGRAVDAALAAVAETSARAAALARAVERQEAVVRTERLALEVGAGIQTDFLAAQADLLTASAGLTRSRHAAVAAHIELARLLGTLDEDWIRTNLEWQ